MKAMLHFAAVVGVLFATTINAAEPRTLLFVDDEDILYRSGAQRVLQQPKRHAANPLLTGPTIKNQVAYSSVHRDPATDRYQMWYQMTGHDCVVCYAESADGLT